MKRLFARHRLDIKARDLIFAAAAMTATGSDRAAARVEAAWSGDGSALACYSVRSGFHLLLAALDLPPRSEVVFSAVTHPDMPRIARHHGLVPVPVDLDPATLAPHPEALARAVTARTRLVVVAHLFGGHVDLEHVAAICNLRGIALVEDCAQSFQGPGDRGDPLATVSMFSFGILKTTTTLGGAMLTVRDRALLGRMRELQRGWSLQTRRSHLKRIGQTSLFLALTRPWVYALVATALGPRFDTTVNSAVKAFPATSTGELVSRLERRPGAPVLALLRHRLVTFDERRLMLRAACGERLASMLPAGVHVGRFGLGHSHWLFPVVCEDAETLIASARAAGFDAARSASSVNAIAASEDRPELEPACARAVMSRLVFLPAYPELPAGAFELLRSVVDGRGTR